MRIKIENLSKIYADGHKALNGLNLEIEPGMFGLLGPNGAGKTTLMRILTLLQSSTSVLYTLTITILPGIEKPFVRYWDICLRISVFLKN